MKKNKEKLKSCCEEEMIFLYVRCLTFAQSQKQTIGEKNDYYIKLWQLEAMIKAIQEGAFNNKS